jgi:curved DNA-binding protein CbpA
VAEDAFDILGLQPGFGLDQGSIDRAYFARSAALHPDLAADPDAPRRMAALNDAKRTLEDPESRADAALRRLGGPAREQERGLPDGFLMEIMETRQEIEAAVSSGDPAERRRWQNWAADQRRRAIQEVGAMFRALPPDPPAETLRAIRVRLNAWRYIERLIEQLDPGYDPARADFTRP